MATTSPPSSARTTPSATRSVSLVLGGFAFIAYAYFHPGAGWNQNARFAQIRAVVEEGSFAIDPFLVYQRRAGGAESTSLERIPVERGTIRTGDETWAFTWDDEAGPPIDESAATGAAERVRLTALACSGDVAYRDGHFFPNKAPGPTMLAVPAYAAAHAIERGLGVDPDDAVVLHVNLWLVSVTTVGLIAALGVALFVVEAARVTRAPAASVALAAAAFAFGTPYFAYATWLYEHDLVAVFLLAAYAAAARVDERWGAALASGFAAALAVASNYVALAALPAVLLYALARSRRLRVVIPFGAGGLVVLLALAAWNLAAYGAPIVSHYEGELPLYRTEGAWLGVFTPPSPTKLLAVFFSPFRGFFVTAPVLLLAPFAFVPLLRDRERALDAVAALAVAFPFFLFTFGFEHWHGGGSYAPRYLIPALPFVALALPLAVERARRLFVPLAALSVAVNLLSVAVDPQTPVGVHAMATDPRRPVWSQSPLLDYTLPLFLTGRAGPVVDGYRAMRLDEYEEQLRRLDVPAAERETRLEEASRTIDSAIAARDPAVPLAAVEGPVSAGVIGPYEGGWFKLFPPGSPAVRAASFNVGELVFPGSRLSLVPLLGFALLVALRLRRLTHAPPTGVRLDTPPENENRWPA